MSIQHKFLNYNWENGFYTENSILKNKEYLPEILFVGTFNHGWHWNTSDFFYGRGMYMWPNLANLFLHNQNILDKTRNLNNDNPSLEEIFAICKKGKISFADIIEGTKENINIIEESRSVLVNNGFVWNDYKDKPLNNMGNQNWLENNVKEICKYVNENPSIKNIYFTFKSAGNWIDDLKRTISDNTPNTTSCSIFTPTGNGFRKNLEPPFNNRPFSLLHCWVWNGIEHNLPINKTGYCNLNHEWLIRNGVNPNNF
ncbi:MAG: hypothetical protein V4548_08460 [Bacteroidota bacterium]